MKVEQYRELINSAMTKAAGDVAQASILCGWTQRRLRQRIQEDPQLHRWIKDGPPDAADVLTRDPIVVDPAFETDQRIGIALVEEDKVFQRDLRAAGITPDHVEHVIALRNLVSHNFKGTTELMHGGMVKLLIDCGIARENWAAIRQKAVDQLQDTAKYPVGSADRALVLSEARAAHSAEHECGEMIIACNQAGYRGLLAIALMRQNRKNGKLGYQETKTITSDD